MFTARDIKKKAVKSHFKPKLNLEELFHLIFQLAEC